MAAVAFRKNQQEVPHSSLVWLETMAIPHHLQEIPGATELHDWFGHWPTFHDAEVISLHLNRQGTSALRVHTWETTNQVDTEGCYILTKHVVVEFLVDSVSNCVLGAFNHQNVISGLAVEKTDSGYRLILSERYGLTGSIDLGSIRIRITPGKPS
jgi:Immunity protein 50